MDREMFPLLFLKPLWCIYNKLIENINIRMRDGINYDQFVQLT